MCTRVPDLRRVKERYDNMQNCPIVNGAALTLNQLAALFREPMSPYMQKVFETYILRRVGPSGAAVAAPSSELKADLAELLTLLALTAEGSAQDRACLLFTLFDLNGDGSLHRDELHMLVSAVLKATTQLQLAFISTEHISQSIESAVASVINFCQKYSVMHSTKGLISLQKFSAWSVQSKIPRRFEALCNVSSRARRLVELWNRRTSQLNRRDLNLDQKCKQVAGLFIISCKMVHCPLGDAASAGLMFLGQWN